MRAAYPNEASPHPEQATDRAEHLGEVDGELWAVDDGLSIGTATTAELREARRLGMLPDSWKAWREGMGHWRVVGELDELAVPAWRVEPRVQVGAAPPASQERTLPPPADLTLETTPTPLSAVIDHHEPEPRAGWWRGAWERLHVEGLLATLAASGLVVSVFFAVGARAARPELARASAAKMVVRAAHESVLRPHGAPPPTEVASLPAVSASTASSAWREVVGASHPPRGLPRTAVRHEREPGQARQRASAR